MKEEKTMHKFQFNVDNILYEKWHTFLRNNNSVFNNGQLLFRYMLNNIEELTEKNESLTSKNTAEINRLEKENIELKKELYKLQKDSLENSNELVINYLEKIKKEVEIIEVLTSTQMVANSSHYRMQNSKDSSMYLEAKQKVENSNLDEDNFITRRPF